MRKSCHILNIAVFALILTVVGTVLLFAPRESVSETERRSLEGFPEFSFNSLFSGEYTSRLSVYFSDTVPFREKLLEASSQLKNYTGVRADGVKLHNVIIADGSDGEITQSDKTEEVLPQTDWDGVIDEVSFDINAVADVANNGILVYGDRGLMLYGGSKQQGERYAKALNSYREQLGEEVNIYSMLIPTSVEFYCPNDYRGLSGDQRDNINHINTFLDGVKPVNIYGTLAARADEEIYLRTDHHWSPLGAYYAAEEFCKSAGVDFTPLHEYEKVTVSGYVGTMYGYSGDVRLKNNPEDFVYYKPPGSYETTYYDYDSPQIPVSGSLFIDQSVGMSYCVFMGGDTKTTVIKTDVDNGRVLAVFKDSFGNALIPFLTGSFEEIIVIDIRYFTYKAVDYLRENNVSDVLFCNNIFAANTGSLIGYIEEIM